MLKLVVLLIIGGILYSSCSKIDEFLDRSPTGGLSENQVFSSYRQTEQFLAGIYVRLPSGWLPTEDASNTLFSFAAASDEAICSVEWANGPHVFTQGLVNANYNPMDNWSSMYAGIRAVHIFLGKIDGLTVNTPTQEAGKRRMKGEAYGLRAWFYMELFKRYGGVPIIDKVLGINDDLNLPRNTAEETVDFIVASCDLAAELLDVSYTATEVGRLTTGAILMLKTEALVFAASPLHNPTNDVVKWQRAAAAAKDVVDLGVYALDRDYAGLFNTRNSASIIFQSTNNYTHWGKINFLPSLGGDARVQPLQNLVDAYEMKESGKAISETGSGYDPNNPYVGRDPRFYASILYNGSKWKGVNVNTYVGAGTDAVNTSGGTSATRSGYYLAKTVDVNANLTPNLVVGEHYWIHMRYEDLLLYYAEALNEVLPQPDDVVYSLVNQVRTRAGVDMPPLAPGLSKVQMRAKIRQERRVELAFEGKRFWDIRRWGIGEDVMTEAWGMVISRSGNDFNYRTTLITERVYRPHFDLFPISRAELTKQPALRQNSGY